MPVFFKSWGLDGSLRVTDFSSLQSNGVVGHASTHGFGASGGAYCERVVKDGFQAVKMVVTPSDLITANGHRTELLPATSTGSGTTDYVGISDWVGQENTERWYRFSFMLPEFDITWLENPVNTWLVVTQLHQDPDDTPPDVTANPPIAFEIRNGNIVVINTGCADTVTTGSNNRITRELYSTPLEFNKWYDFIINVKWSWTTLGKVRIWSDRKQVYHDIAAVNCANNDPSRGSNGNYAKIGIYTHYPMNDYYNKPLVIYHRGMIVGNESCSFSDMFPESITTVYPINPTILDSNISYIG